MFAANLEAFRGWGRTARRGVAAWFEDMEIDRLALQAIKYKQRGGWSLADLLRLSHPTSKLPMTQENFEKAGYKEGESLYPPIVDEPRAALYDYIAHGWPKDKPELIKALPDQISIVELLNGPGASADKKGAKAAATLIRDHRIPREAVPSELLNSPDVWGALLDDMPITAMIRNLGKMTSIKLVAPGSDAMAKVVDRLRDVQRLHRGRVHPIAILIALKTYATGHGLRGKLEWQPVPQVLDALNDAFHNSFQTIQPTGKRILLALDVSGSMTYGEIAGTPLTPREGAAAMAMVTARTELRYHIVSFQHQIVPLSISASQRLDDVMRTTYRLPFGRTDCAQPMLYALEHNLEFDAFVTITDNETWCGGVHPMQALQRYREKTGIPAKNVVVGMTATNFTIADPNDAASLDVVGFDAATPNVLADFIRGGDALQ
jgi:60 kDa SS-A/Ro ribonucleoprotein